MKTGRNRHKGAQMTEIEKIIKRADELLKQTESVELAGIDPNGYPHIFEMEVMANSNIRTVYFTTGIYSGKVSDFKKNTKAALNVCLNQDCISMIGDVKVIEHPEEKRRLWITERTKQLQDMKKEPLYCILQFTGEILYYYFDGEKGFFHLDE